MTGYFTLTLGYSYVDPERSISAVPVYAVYNPRTYSYLTPRSSYASWATETVLSPWLAADEDRVTHVLSHVVWWKKLSKVEYVINQDVQVVFLLVKTALIYQNVSVIII